MTRRHDDPHSAKEQLLGNGNLTLTAAIDGAADQATLDAIDLNAGWP